MRYVSSSQQTNDNYAVHGTATLSYAGTPASFVIPAEYVNRLDNEKEVQSVTMKRDKDRKLL